MEFTVKNKPLDIKFNFLQIFKIEKYLSKTYKESKGLFELMEGLVYKKDQSILDILNALVPKGITENDLAEAINAKSEAEGYDAMYQELLETAKASGVFMEKMKALKKQTALVTQVSNLEKPEDKKALSISQKMIDDFIG